MTVNTPDACAICGRQATGAGIAGTRKGEPWKWLCTECLLIVNQIKEVRRLKPYEEKALHGGMAAAGSFLEDLGKTDLSSFEEEEALMLVDAIWKGCADEIRRLIKEGEAPF